MEGSMTGEGWPPLAALQASGPDPRFAPRLQMFGQFVGSWDLVHETVETGALMDGEVHFGWALNGRAVQDVWVAPRQPSVDGRQPMFWGSTIRFYDEALGAWRSTWIDPVKSRVLRFVARPDGDRIVLSGLDKEPVLHRWSFNDITSRSFLWKGEVSRDGGRSWELEQVMRARRC
jgi:hypothetical protein